MKLFDYSVVAGSRNIVLAGFLAGGIWILPAGAQSAGQSPASPAAPASPAVPAAKAPLAPPSRYLPNPVPRRAALYYDSLWGVDSLTVKLAESGEMVRFSYRILDPVKAKALNNKRSEPSLEDPQAGVKLVVPSIEQIGLLRQSSTPIAGKAYWMAFSNSGRRVKRGDRVNVVIGAFRADGLIVQ